MLYGYSRINFLKNVITALQDSITEDKFYGVSVEAANIIGSFYDKNNYEKSDRSFQALISILKNRVVYDDLRPEIKKSDYKEHWII